MDFRSENKVKIEGGMSTMTDLVFLLLIFFIVISTLITAGVNIDVPKNGGSSSEKKILEVNINDNNEFFLDGKRTPIKSEAIEKQILQSIGRDSIISLYGSAKSDWQASVLIIDLAKHHNFKLVMNSEK
ncbi:MAG: biopolymer transporter ExbD [Bacteroidota bacterium]|nr:biopolymer transporter ExbD [Bacteroidota bacterium]MEC8969250.1 biopolymer transporter ExbD [Bacteroidota bacterium]